ncbi:MAG TPA: peptidoglycan-binding protein [Acidimicrobiales bacterium]|nr:peptidoglycan-binding protein [Acidimicrobiales bacterium]
MRGRKWSRGEPDGHDAERAARTGGHSPERPPGPTTSRHDAVLSLQRAAGNAAVTAFVQRKPGAAGALVLKRGSKGPLVRELQELLNSTSLLPKPVDVDGDFGPSTVRAVRLAQARLAVAVDGKAGPRTMGALRSLAQGRTAKAEATGKAAARADDAWAVGAQAHADSMWERALAAYAEVVTLAEEAGNSELQAAAAARIREVRLRKPPTPYGDLRTATPPTEDSHEVTAKRAIAERLYRNKQYEQALAAYLAVYEASGGGPNASEDAWSIANCYHRLSNFDDAASWYRETATHFTSGEEDSFALIVFERTREATLHKPPTPSDELKQKYLANLEGRVDPEQEEKTDELRDRSQAAEVKYAAGDVRGALGMFLDVYRDAAPFTYSLAEVLYNIGICHHDLGHYEQAVEFYRQSREVNRGRAWYISSAARLGADGSGLAADAAHVREHASARIAKALRHQKS